MCDRWMTVTTEDAAQGSGILLRSVHCSTSTSYGYQGYECETGRIADAEITRYRANLS